MRQPTFFLINRFRFLASAFVLAFVATGTFSSNVAICKTDEHLKPVSHMQSQSHGRSADDTLLSTFKKRFLLDAEDKRLARVVTVMDVKAPAETVQQVLSDFTNFPRFMKRVKTCEVTRREGNLYFTESYLKSQLFVTEACNHTITDVLTKPNTIEWVLIDGNFATACGRWHIDPVGSTCRVTYTVAVAPPPMVPSNIVEVGMKVVQKEVIGGVKTRAEELARLSRISNRINTEPSATSHANSLL